MLELWKNNAPLCILIVILIVVVPLLIFYLVKAKREHPKGLIAAALSNMGERFGYYIMNAVLALFLASKFGISDDAAQRISRLANGSWLKAMEALQAGAENEQFLDMFMMLMRLAYQRRVRELRKWSETMAGFGREKQKRFLQFFLRMLRENFMYNFQQQELVYMTQEEEDFAKNFARFINEANILQLYDLTNLAIRDIGQNANAKIVFFDFALKMIVLLIQK